MPSIARRLSIAAALALAASASAAAPRASALPPALEGAWLEQSVECNKVFALSGKRLAYKRPANAFAPAFIASGGRLATPLASCSVASARQDGERWRLNLNCATSVSYSDARVDLALKPDGTVIRYLNPEDDVGSRYRKCTAADL